MNEQKCSSVGPVESWNQEGVVSAGVAEPEGKVGGSKKASMVKTPGYKVWGNMKSRCYNKANPEYRLFGAKGIKRCERWNSFKSFIEDMGDRPSKDHRLVRLDKNGDFEPGNCRWEIIDKRQAVICGDIAKVPLKGGRYAIIDSNLAGWASQYNWWLNNKGYAARTTARPEKRNILMHREILGFPDLEIDHKDGDSLNNTRNNLRLATHAQNMANMKIQSRLKDDPKRFKGVSRIPGSTKYRSRIKHNGQEILIGCFDNPVDAHNAYQESSLKLKGEFARFR